VPLSRLIATTEYNIFFSFARVPDRSRLPLPVQDAQESVDRVLALQVAAHALVPLGSFAVQILLPGRSGAVLRCCCCRAAALGSWGL
jgi:hypothetical protein